MVCSSFPSDGDEGDDYFIPLPHASVSKFGPISRMAKAKTGNAAPVQVTADVRIYLLFGYDFKYFILLLGLELAYIINNVTAFKKSIPSLKFSDSLLIMSCVVVLKIASELL